MQNQRMRPTSRPTLILFYCHFKYIRKKIMHSGDERDAIIRLMAPFSSMLNSRRKCITVQKTLRKTFVIQ